MIASSYFLTALLCFVPFYHFGSPLLLVPALTYAFPPVLIGWGLIRRREWGRRLAMVMSLLLILTVMPLLFKQKLTVFFAIPYSVAVTYPSSAAVPFKSLFSIVILGHFASTVYLLRRSVKEKFQK